MTAQHTPGPWRVEEDRRSDYDIFTGRWDGPEYTAGWNVESDSGEVIGTEGIIPSNAAEANARLIAASPELLAALEALHAFAAQTCGGMAWHYADQDAAKLAESVIAKARGLS